MLERFVSRRLSLPLSRLSTQLLSILSWRAMSRRLPKPPRQSLSTPMRRSMLMPLRGRCRLGLSRQAVSALRTQGASKAAPIVAERSLPDFLGLNDGAPEAWAKPIAEALAAVGAARLPVHVTLGDDLVRYFIVTPPANSASMRDLRAAAVVRFQMLYGEPVSAWQLAGDWQAGTPFLACAVPQRLVDAVQLAVAAERGRLLSVTPNFVAAWNRVRDRLGPGAWLATLHNGALTLGLVAHEPARRLAAVRTLVLPESAPPASWLRDQVARAALLDNLPAPSMLYVDGPRLDAWVTRAAPAGENGLAVHWCASGLPGGAGDADTKAISSAAQLAWGRTAP
jgi:hypothetical protein